MSRVIFQSVLFLGLSFSTYAAVSIIGPYGRVQLFYQDGERVIAKECRDYASLALSTDCEVVLGEGQRIREYDSVSDIKEILRASLRTNIVNWDEEMKKKVIFYNKRENEDIKVRLKKEMDLMKKIADREDFAKKYGSEFIDSDELDNLKDELEKMRSAYSDQMGAPVIQEIEREIEKLVALIVDENEKPHFYIFPKDDGSFVSNILNGFWEVSIVDNFQEIPTGRFMMGSPFDEAGRLNDEEGADGKPIEVIISRGFEMMSEEVTQQQWFEVMGGNPSRYNQPEHCDDHKVVSGIHLCPNNPVDGVSWNEIQTFVGRLNTLGDLVGCDGTPGSARGCYRLPTEAEWEYAARGGTQTAYSFGGDAKKLGEYAWYGLNSNRQSHKVGQLKPNPFGLYDMHGNVWEWVLDGYVEKLPGGTDPFQPQVEQGVFHVVRGGSWFHIEQDLRSAFRKGVYTDNRYNNIGFRLVRSM